MIEWVAAVLLLGADGSIERREIRAPDAIACVQMREEAWQDLRAVKSAPETGLLIGGCHRDRPAGADAGSWIMRP